MLEGALTGAVGVLSVAGGLALLWRAARSAARLLLRVAEVTAVAGMAEASARRGDLTGMQERRALERSAR
ncbi:MAG TPA: hypothetical protein VHG91_11405, partial [Longimicrobium sp.]|nr:hypothetical protein [Longimicrobium sp.]